MHVVRMSVRILSAYIDAWWWWCRCGRGRRQRRCAHRPVPPPSRRQHRCRWSLVVVGQLMGIEDTVPRIGPQIVSPDTCLLLILCSRKHATHVSYWGDLDSRSHVDHTESSGCKLNGEVTSLYFYYILVFKLINRETKHLLDILSLYICYL